MLRLEEFGPALASQGGLQCLGLLPDPQPHSSPLLLGLCRGVCTVMGGKAPPAPLALSP